MARVHTLKLVFAWFLERPALIGQAAESLARLEISHQGLGRFRESLLDAAMRNPHLAKSALDHNLASAGVGELAEEVRRSNRLAFSLTSDESDRERTDQRLVCVRDGLGGRGTGVSGLNDCFR